jgi:Flp pilus assembly protein CpaB
MTVGESAPRRVHRRQPFGAHLVMILAGVLGLVLTLAALTDSGGGERIAVAARDLQPGVPLRDGDLRFETMSVASDVLEHLVLGSERRLVRGRVLTVAVSAGEPLVSTRIRARATPDGRRAMSIPVERARAVNGRLARGDRVDVVAASGGVASVIAAGLEVLDVEDDRDGAFGSQRGLVTVTLAVDVDDSQRLAAVLADGDFVLTRVTGAISADGTPPLVVDELAGSR